jgi:hypothetical protein
VIVPSPAGMSLTKLSLAKNNFIIPMPRFIKRSFSSWKHAENAHFWKRSFWPKDKRWSETWVVFSSFSACFRPHQTKTLVLEENLKTTPKECFQRKRAT